MSDGIESKIDKIVEHIGSIDVTLAKQAVQLENHIHRTELAEQNIDLLRKDFKPVERNVVMVSGALKLIGLVALMSGIVEAIVSLLTYLRK